MKRSVDALQTLCIQVWCTIQAWFGQLLITVICFDDVSLVIRHNVLYCMRRFNAALSDILWSVLPHILYPF